LHPRTVPRDGPRHARGGVRPAAVYPIYLGMLPFSASAILRSDSTVEIGAARGTCSSRCLFRLFRLSIGNMARSRAKAGRLRLRRIN